jgi:hypothetical protein
MTVPTYLLDGWQVSTLLDLADGIEPGPGSPLLVVPRGRRPLAEGEPGFDELVDRSLVVFRDGRWQTNLAIRAVLGAVCRPEEVLSVGVDEPGLSGFSAVRRGPVVAECTVAHDGTTRLAFPLTRTAVLLTIVGALSGDRPEPPPTGFRFIGSAAEAFVLAATLRRLRQDPIPLTVAALRDAVTHDASVAGYRAPFAAAGAPDAIASLAADRSAVDAAIESLVASGPLELHLDHVAVPARTLEVLGGTPRAVLGLGRTEVVDGRARTTSITATRIGDRILAFRVLSPAGGETAYEWAEVTRQDLRWLAFGLVLSSQELDRVQAGERLEAAVDEPAPPTGSPGSPAPEAPSLGTAAWAPTHAVPASGLWAFADPDPQAQPVAALDPWLPVQVDRTWGAWAHVVCENGWEAWVDGRALDAT